MHHARPDRTLESQQQMRNLSSQFCIERFRKFSRVVLIGPSESRDPIYTQLCKQTHVSFKFHATIIYRSIKFGPAWLGYLSYPSLAIIIPIIKHFKIFQFKFLPLHINLNSWCKRLFNANAPPATLLQVRKVYEVKLGVGFSLICKIYMLIFFNGTKFEIFPQKWTKIRNFCCMKSIKMHEKPHQNPMGL